MAAATIVQAREQWGDASTIDDADLEDLLDAAWAGCVAFLPVEVVTDLAYVPTPAHIMANVLNARDAWAAARRDGDVIGFDSYAVRVRPLSGTVQQLLRPRRGVPMVG